MLMLFLYFLLKENLPESNVKSVEGQLSGQGIIQNENEYRTKKQFTLTRHQFRIIEQH